MAEVTVKQFADVVGVSLDRLRAQLEEAGLSEKQSSDLISDDEKSQLLTHLRRAHGKDETGTEPSKVTLKRKTVTELKVPTERTRMRSRPKAGPSKTVSVEFRRKRTYVKRSVVSEDESSSVDESALEPNQVKAEDDAVTRVDEEALAAFELCARLEGIIPALEPSHALAYLSTVIGDMDADDIVILNMCGRGDKDLGAVLPVLEKLGRM